MENKMILKVYDVDYSFIIKNYLDQKSWEKEWTLFVYKKFAVTLRLKYIYIYRNKITFEICLTDNNKSNLNRSVTKEVDYSLNTDNMNILKKAINTKIQYAIEEIEKILYICRTDEYYRLEEIEDEEREKLTKIAEEFLDDNNIENENVREAYIDAYVDNTEKVYSMKYDYRQEMKYKMLPDLYLTFARATNNENLEEEVLAKNEENKETLLQEIESLETYLQTEQFEEEAKESLEEV